MTTPGKGIHPAARALVLAVFFLGCSKPLPAEGTPQAELYRERCGTCHRPVLPSVMPYATWQMILPRMEQRIRAAAQAPLSADERRAIEDYLRQYSR